MYTVNELQGDQGVEQILVKAEVIAKGNLSYSYRIISGKGTLNQVDDYAILESVESKSVVIELVVKGKKSITDRKTVRYSKRAINKEKIYLEKKDWELAIGKRAVGRDAYLFQERDLKLPNVLIIGNSISIGYTPFVQKELKGKANVYRIPENGGDINRGLKKFDFWMGDNQWDVIHFNFGLHDMKRLINNKLDIKGDRVNTEEEYKNKLEKFVELLQTKTKAKLIWATISVVPDGADGRIKGEEVIYNKIALEIMKKNNIAIDDQYTLTDDNPSDQKPRDVHFLPKGCERQGKQVAKSIMSMLAE